MLWPLFGATNQLVAGLTLLVATIYLWRKGRPVIYTLIPMAFLIFITLASMIWNFRVFSNKPLLLVLSALILAFGVWIVLETYFVYAKVKKASGQSEVSVSDR